MKCEDRVIPTVAGIKTPCNHVDPPKFENPPEKELLFLYKFESIPIENP